MTLLMFACLAPAAGVLRAQSTTERPLRIASSVDWAIDPRSVALGEATVALPGSGDAFASNPAGLAGRAGIWAEYARRSWWTGNDDMQYRAWSAGFATPLGVFMLSYRRDDMGEFRLTSVSSPDGSAAIRWYDHTAGIAWGYSLGQAIQVGAAVKLSKEVHSLLWGTIPSGQAGELMPQVTVPVLFDLGLICNTGSLFGTDNLSVGAAAENFGSPERQSITQYSPSYIYGPGTTVVVPGYTTYEYIQPLPRMLRIGLSYQYRLGAPEGSGKPAPLEVAAVAEYRDILNAKLGEPSTYWGMGLEVTAFEILTGRVGGVATPYDGIYGNKNTLAARWGVGAQLPLELLSPALPKLRLTGSYSWQPLQPPGDGPEYPTISTFGLGIRYELPGSAASCGL